MATNLGAGDIAFIAYQSDNPDRFDFVLLVDVDAGTQITFTDNGVTDAGAFRANEGTATWTAPSALNAGTVVSYQGANVGDFTNSDSLDLSASGDQIIAYQGDANSPTFIAALHMNGAFDSDATTSNTSALPTGLVEGESALAISPEVDNGFYSGVTAGTADVLRAAINNAANWTVSDTRQTTPDLTFIVDGAGNPQDSIVINEIDADNPGSDSAEFVELFGAPNTALDGLTIVFFNGNASNNTAYEAFDLDGQSLDAGGYFVLGNPSVTNVDLTFDPGSQGALQNGADAVALYKGDATDFPNGTSPTTTDLIDAIVYDTNDADDDELIAALGQTTQFNEGGAGDKDNDSLQRDPNGTGDFTPLTPTPGAENGGGDNGGGDNGGGEATLRLISAIQGDGDSSPFDNTSVIVEAIVTADFQDEGVNGFYLQEEKADDDGNASTSEGLFVFEGGSTVDVSVGDTVRVTGSVLEFNDKTEITDVTSVEIVTDREPDVDLSTLINPATLELPLSQPANSLGGNPLEAFEGMYVDIAQELFVTQLFEFERFGTLHVSSGGRLPNPTQVALPGEAANAQAAANDLNRIILDDASNAQNQPDFPSYLPDGDVRGGDSFTAFNGVLDWDFGNYRLRTNQPLELTRNEPRQEQPDDVDGSLKVASFNVLNYFTTLDDGTGGTGPDDEDPRGANNDLELEIQTDKIVAALTAIDADIYGLIELENDGFGAEGAAATLVEALNAETGENYAFVDYNGFVGTDVITNALIYDTDTVSLTEGSAVVLDDASFTDPLNTGQGRNRPAVAAAFEETSSGEVVNVVVNHYKSKGSGTGAPEDDDQGDGQASSNGTRTAASGALVEWINTDPTGSGDDDYLLIGDYNAYAMEDPIRALQDAGYTDLAATMIGGDPLEPYSFRFSGEWGALDYAFANDSLLGQVSDATIWHINSEEPTYLDYNDNVLDSEERSFEQKPDALFAEVDASSPARSSDHDPIIVGLDLGPEFNLIAGTNGRNFLRGTGEADEIDAMGGSDRIVALGGNDLIFGGTGRDRIDGGEGDDEIHPGEGRDFVVGGPGADIMVVTDNGGNDLFRDFNAADGDGVLIDYGDVLLNAETMLLDSSRITVADSRANLLIRLDLDDNGSTETTVATLSGAAGLNVEDVIVNPLDNAIS